MFGVERKWFYTSITGKLYGAGKKPTKVEHLEKETQDQMARKQRLTDPKKDTGDENVHNPENKGQDTINPDRPELEDIEETTPKKKFKFKKPTPKTTSLIDALKRSNS